MKYYFDQPLLEGIIVRRKSQFTMEVNIDGSIYNCHCPTTGRIGDLEVKGLSCLVSKSSDPKRKTPFTVEAVSADNPDCVSKAWIGINQILSNKLVEFFFQTHQLDAIVSNYDHIQREVKLGASKLDFLVGDVYLEVKTPLTTLQVNYGDQVHTKPTTPFSSTDRFVKHINELAGALAEHERAVLLTVYQYVITAPKPRQRSTNYEEVSAAVKSAIDRGVQSFQLTMRFECDGVTLVSCTDTTTQL